MGAPGPLDMHDFYLSDHMPANVGSGDVAHGLSRSSWALVLEKADDDPFP